MCRACRSWGRSTPRDAILTLAGLGFLGIGIQPTEAAEWGYDLQRALDDAGSGVWWTGFYPGMAIVLLVLGLTLVGEGLNETLNPTLRRRRLLPVVMSKSDKVERAEDAIELNQNERVRNDHAGAGDVVPATARVRSSYARDVRVWYGTTVVQSARSSAVSFDLELGARPSGWWQSPVRGKSTLGRGLMGLLPEGAKRDGEVLYKGMTS